MKATEKYRVICTHFEKELSEEEKAEVLTVIADLLGHLQKKNPERPTGIGDKGAKELAFELKRWVLLGPEGYRAELKERSNGEIQG